MQEVEGFVNGTLDYYELKGDTGPLVYPAGFVYIYTLLYGVTSRGLNIKLAQYIFVAIYLSFLGLVYLVHRKTKRVSKQIFSISKHLIYWKSIFNPPKVPPIAFILMSLTSHRIHSIFILRLFNDPIAVMLLFASIACFLHKKWSVGCLFYR